MAVEIEEDDSVGRTSYYIPLGERSSEIPAIARAELDEADLAFFRDPDAGIAGMIGRCRHDGLRSWLEVLRGLGYFRLEVHIWENGITDVVHRFRHSNPELDEGSAFALPDDDPVGELHPVLVPIFEIIGGTMHSSGPATDHDLFSPPHEPFSSMGWIEDSPEIDPDECFILYDEPDGNAIGWHPSGRVVYCDHGELSWIGDLAEHMDGYFAFCIEKQS